MDKILNHNPKKILQLNIYYDDKKDKLFCENEKLPYHRNIIINNSSNLDDLNKNDDIINKEEDINEFIKNFKNSITNNLKIKKNVNFKSKDNSIIYETPKKEYNYTYNKNLPKNNNYNCFNNKPTPNTSKTENNMKPKKRSIKDIIKNVELPTNLAINNNISNNEEYKNNLLKNHNKKYNKSYDINNTENFKKSYNLINENLPDINVNKEEKTEIKNINKINNLKVEYLTPERKITDNYTLIGKQKLDLKVNIFNKLPSINNDEEYLSYKEENNRNNNIPQNNNLLYPYKNTKLLKSNNKFNHINFQIDNKLNEALNKEQAVLNNNASSQTNNSYYNKIQNNYDKYDDYDIWEDNLNKKKSHINEFNKTKNKISIDEETQTSGKIDGINLKNKLKYKMDDNKIFNNILKVPYNSNKNIELNQRNTYKLLIDKSVNPDNNVEINKKLKFNDKIIEEIPINNIKYLINKNNINSPGKQQLNNIKYEHKNILLNRRRTTFEFNNNLVDYNAKTNNGKNLAQLYYENKNLNNIINNIEEIIDSNRLKPKIKGIKFNNNDAKILTQDKEFYTNRYKNLESINKNNNKYRSKTPNLSIQSNKNKYIINSIENINIHQLCDICINNKLN